jgi:hypothetical protein
VKNFLIVGLLCFSTLASASENSNRNNTQQEERVAAINKAIATCEKREKTCLSIFATCAATIGSYFCAHAYKSKNSKPIPMLMRCFRSKAIPRVSGAVGATSFLAWLVINGDKMSWERDAYSVWLETHPQPAYVYDPLRDDNEDPFDIRHYGKDTR